MPQATVYAATITGVEAQSVEVQADVSSGLPGFSIVGLADTAVQEARDRVRSAVRASGFEFPNARVLVNLAPAPLRKHGTGFDLPIALAILTATRQIPAILTESATAVGELSLDGSVRPVSGALAYALAASRSGYDLIGPIGALGPAQAVDGLTCRCLNSLQDLRQGSLVDAPQHAAQRPEVNPPDLSEVAGHEGAKRVLEIAAAGGHNLLMIGPPGSGKTLLARRLPGIMPPLDKGEILDSALVHSVAGLDETSVLDGVRPFRAPHHTCSIAGLAGGGSPPRPGEMSLAHNGVLFLDELPEFSPSALQTLRQPMEDGALTLVRAEGRVRYPARFTLVAAMNPCPCGFLGDPERACKCAEGNVRRYAARIGGPLMDRMDLVVRVDRIDPDLLLGAAPGEATSIVRERVLKTREFARLRGGLSAALAGAPLLSACRLTPTTARLFSETARSHHLSGRAVTRILRVARTLADMDKSSEVLGGHLAEAVGYRGWENQ